MFIYCVFKKIKGLWQHPTICHIKISLIKFRKGHQSQIQSANIIIVYLYRNKLINKIEISILFIIFKKCQTYTDSN